MPFEAKVYFDGSHYIATPKTFQPHKKRKNFNIPKNTGQEEKAKEIYKSCTEKTRKKKVEFTINEINKEIQNEEKSTEIVTKVVEKEKRNKVVRNTRLFRKANLQQWNYFCTFTYDSNKMDEDEFRKKLLNTLGHFSNRKDWRYIGVFERTPENNRLHFHCLLAVKEMVGTFEKTKDYSTTNHQMQKTNQNSFFLEKFGRNDFKPIENNFGANDSLKYMMKYMEKSGERFVYSKHLKTYFKTIIRDEDVVCPIGIEDRKRLMYDDFNCTHPETGEVLGSVSQEVIEQLPKAY